MDKDCAQKASLLWGQILWQEQRVESLQDGLKNVVDHKLKPSIRLSYTNDKCKEMSLVHQDIFTDEARPMLEKLLGAKLAEEQLTLDRLNEELEGL